MSAALDRDLAWRVVEGRQAVTNAALVELLRAALDPADRGRPPGHTGGDWTVDDIVRGLAASLHKRGLIEERPDEKIISRLTVALAEAFGTNDLGVLAQRLAPSPVKRLNRSDQCVALVQAQPYGCGFGAHYSTEREADLLDRLNAAGYEVVEVPK